MSTASPSPMRVPDLAGLLTRPNRSTSTEQGKALPDPAPDSPPLQAEVAVGPDFDNLKPERTTSVDIGDAAAAKQKLPTSIPAADVPEGKRASRAKETPTRRTRPSSTSGLKAVDATDPMRHDRQYKQSISYSLPRSIYEAVSDAARDRQTSITALILEALNATHQELGEYFSTEDQVADGDLFSVPKERVTADPIITSTIRVTDAQLSAMKMLAARHSVPRTKLVATALSVHLRLT